jgi:cytidylate kinase
MGEPQRIMTATAPSHVVIAIDGPSGAGKSTAAKRLAWVLGYQYVDSGAMYRAVGWVAHASVQTLKDTRAIVTLLGQTSIELTFTQGRSEVWVNGKNITCRLRGEAVGHAASAVAMQSEVRQAITAKLRQLRCQADLVMEGRDIGTVVFPDATVKFFLDASLEIRTRRRFLEMQQAGHGMSLEQVSQAVAARDAQDRERAMAPLISAPEAHIIDTTDLTVDDVVQIMLSEMHRENPTG